MDELYGLCIHDCRQPRSARAVPQTPRQVGRRNACSWTRNVRHAPARFRLRPPRLSQRARPFRRGQPRGTRRMRTRRGAVEVARLPSRRDDAPDPRLRPPYSLVARHQQADGEISQGLRLSARTQPQLAGQHPLQQLRAQDHDPYARHAVDGHGSRHRLRSSARVRRPP